MSIDIAKARQLIAAASPGPWTSGSDPSHFDAPEVRGVMLAYYVPRDADASFIAYARDALPAALDRIEQLQAALVEACDIADELLNGCEVDETLDAKRIDELRALAAGEVTPAVVEGPSCKRCNDTRRMSIGEMGWFMCTACQVPCNLCRTGGYGPYCTSPECNCACHVRKAAGEVTP